MIYQKKTGLGRGLRALLDDSDLPENDRQQVSNESSSLGSISSVKISQVQVNPFQPRTDFDPEALHELAESIKLQGLIQPITVRQSGQNSYQLISGERRLRASKLAGLTEIPAYVRTANDQQMLEMALIENIQRENLNAIEVALSFQRMIDECNLKQEQLGERVSKNRSTVTNYLRLLKLPPAIQASIRDKEISMGHARALISVEDVDKQLYLFQEIINRGLSVRKVEDLVRQLQNFGKGKKPVKASGMSFQYMKIQDDLASKFSTKVKLKLDEKGKGSIEIGFMSDEDLNRILEMLDW
ncbi:MAG: chromosome partitioning protein ParB [Sphingobacteriales bacterium 17-39-43]|uniref:ParB/RepB/Spo0J family partition protein n=1 Tax=Daejeonella sp. TaxID=2805397 RepID=UPI000BCC916C|nr:ParB/RepB/Spo0J family partition protein [Daejeonella sp.]OYY01999.1 MAG: chromosome partitioning protein ParB [Sphingobacteriia bacterium 35-40-5]OYZ30961.1 MAG: chromosome partitioning protein ParB [Sphingobacteriales bacterium 16-39-50]OZA23812.1 MAG: chromosome partitioning protein ParB [Sphingobacteriales bacterium 17-39-43]OZA57925.1 MAG: chromosome partitioning protein ParB [Sphingobacteriales bacterium 39-40-5]HQS51995.1 ParB/RepB/Spo0J family partition protein [Daejeonella sp.]